MRNIIILEIIMLLFAIFLFSYCINRDVLNKGSNEKVYNDNSLHYNVGDTLLPDYICPDTLIVINAIELNKNMSKLMNDYSKGIDMDIADVIYSYCTTDTKYNTTHKAILPLIQYSINNQNK